MPRCAGCGKRLSPFAKTDNLSYGKVCLCPACMEAWQRAKREMCHTCYMPAGECRCTSINRKIKQPFIPSLFFYHRDRSRVQNKVLYSAKTRRFPELFDFLASELAPSVRALADAVGIDVRDCILTYVPRKKKAIRQYGLDQARELSERLAESLGCVSVSLLQRVGGKEQKRLDGRKREKNTSESVFLRQNLTRKDAKKLALANGEAVTVREAVEGRCVIVVDDIITTGASMRRAILLLEPLRPKDVTVACVARSEKRSK